MRIATDIGGTFTDLVLVDEKGRTTIAKGDTTPPHFEKGVLNLLKDMERPADEMDVFIHGTTVVINTLTERTGVKTGLITTRGFRDVLEIARGNRPDLFNVRYQKPTPFVPRYLRHEVDERLNYKGEVLSPLDLDQLKKHLDDFKEQGVEGVAVCFLHAYTNPSHEKQAVEFIREYWPEVAVTASHEITKEWREYERTNTAVLNAYVKPVSALYINQLEKGLNEAGADAKTYIMQSNGGTTTFSQSKNTPIHMVESGPVAGVYGTAILGELIGEKNLIAFDVGGTTAKCSLINEGEVRITTDYHIERTERSAGYPIKVPVVDIVEIGNGGGSIAWLDDAGSLKVGPKSAGAVPGPIAYGKGGTEPTTTDANLVTGRLSPRNFDYQVNMEVVKTIMEEKIGRPFSMTAEDAALGILRIANSNMLNALKLISVRKGYDPRKFALVAFGGGGPLHATALAKALGVKKVIVPVASSVFAAWGMLMSDLRHDYIQTYIHRLNRMDPSSFNNKWKEMEQQAIEQFETEGFSKDQVQFERFLDMRYLGQEHTVKVPVPGGRLNADHIQEIIDCFHEAHEQHYTFRLEGAETEIVNMHLTAFGKVQKPALPTLKMTGKNVEEALKGKRRVLYEEEGWMEVPVYDRNQMEPEMEVAGPAIIEEKTATCVLYPGQKLTMDTFGNLIIETGV
jgi:N-methylhydantoinase A